MIDPWADSRAFLKQVIGEGLFLAILAPIGYMLVFSYEAGKASAWGIPLKFISLNLTVALTAISTVSLLVFLCFAVFDAFRSTLVYPMSPLKHAVVPFIPVVGFAGIVTWVVWPVGADLISAVWIGIGTLAAQKFLWPLVVNRKIQGYSNKLAEANKRRKDDSGESKQDGEKHRVGPFLSVKTQWLVFSFVLFVGLVYLAGKYNALNREIHLVYLNSNKSQKLVVLEQYDGVFVCAPYDTQQQCLLPKLRFIPISELKTEPAEYEKLGHLEIKWPES